MTFQSGAKSSAAQVSKRPPGRLALRSLLQSREVAVLGLVLVVSVALSLLSPHFLKRANLKVISDAIAADMLCTIGITIVIITGGIDISMGSTVGIAALSAALLMDSGASMWVALLCALLITIAVGCLNGFLVSYVRLNPMIATLAVQVAIRGAGVAKAHGTVIAGLPRQLRVFGQGTVGPIGVPILIAIGFTVVFQILLNYSAFFQQAYFVGGNEKAARMSGVRVEAVKFVVYVISAALAGVAGIITLSRTMVGSSQLGLGTEFRAIPAAVIGGASLVGGEGNLIGPMLGVLLMAIINDALILLGIPADYQGLAQGVILILAVSLDAIVHRGELRS